MDCCDKRPPVDARWTARLLRREIELATGCTEPAAIALCARVAAAALVKRPTRVAAWADVGTFKNALAVGLPGTDLRGPAAAAALGACGDGAPSTLDLLGALTVEHRRRAAELLAAGRATAEPLTERGLLVRASVTDGRRTAEAVIVGRHDRVVQVTLDGIGQPLDRREAPGPPDDDEVMRHLVDAWDIVAAAESLGSSDLEIVSRALEHNRGLVADLPPEVLGCPERLVVAAVDRRMGGRSMAVATSGGSGNSGLTVCLGYWAAAQGRAATEERLLRGLAVAHLANLAVKARIGRVGPLCGGVAASATAVGCGLAWLRGGGVDGVGHVLRSMVDAHAGTLCGGANATCSLKISVALRTAIGLATASDTATASAGLAGGTSAIALERLAGIAAATGPALDAQLLAMLTAPGAR